MAIKKQPVQKTVIKKEETKTLTKDKLYAYVEDFVTSARDNTSVWSQNQLKWNKLRMRIRKDKSFPFIGCSNIRMPTAETKIRKLKAALTNVIFGIRPVVQVVPPPSGNREVAQRIEKWLDHLICDVMPTKQKSIIAIDQELEKGFYVLKPYFRTEITTRIEEYSLDDLGLDEVSQLASVNMNPEMLVKQLMERMEVDTNEFVAEDNLKAVENAAKDVLSGKDKIKVELQDVVYNAPDVALVDPEHLFVNSDAGYDPQSCTFIAHEMFLPFNQVKANAKIKGWDKQAIDEIEEYAEEKLEDPKSLTEEEKDMQEGISRIRSDSSSVRIWEVYCWYDLNNDGTEEKCVITVAPDFKKVLRKITLPYKSGKFPFVKIYYELRDDRWFAHRGIPEIIEDIIKEIDVQHMQKIDQQTIRNTPMFVYRAGMVNPNLVQMIPNQGIPVNGMSPLRDTIDVLNNNNSNVEYSYEREQMLLESKVEELVGQVDYTLQSMINRRQPRTLGEVQLQNQNMQQVFSLDADMHTMAFTELFNWIWELDMQYGDPNIEFMYFGENPSFGGEPVRLSREEVQGKYRVTVRGNDRNTNPDVKLQKAQQILMAATNPVFLQTGVITPVQQAASLKRFYQTLDVEAWEELVNTQAQPQQPQPPSPAMLIKPGFADLTDAEQAQVLSSAGVRPDAQGRQLRKKEEMHDKLLDMSGQIDAMTNFGGE